jgi:hypothetical protein
MHVFYNVETYTDNDNLLFGNIPVADDQLGHPNAAPAAAVVTEGNHDDLLLLLPSRSSGYPALAQSKVPETVPFAAPPYTGANQLPATFFAVANEAMAVAALGTMQNDDPPKDGKKKRSRPVAATAPSAGAPVPPAVALAPTGVVPTRRSIRNTKNMLLRISG